MITTAQLVGLAWMGLWVPAEVVEWLAGWEGQDLMGYDESLVKAQDVTENDYIEGYRKFRKNVQVQKICKFRSVKWQC